MTDSAEQVAREIVFANDAKHGTFYGSLHHHNVIIEPAADLIDAIATALRSSGWRTDVEVVPLVWRDGPYGSELELADSEVGAYYVWAINKRAFWSRYPNSNGIMIRGDIAEAKAAAQADFEQRIRSALVLPQPPATDGTR